MKHNSMIYFLGVWYLIETDKDGKRWAINGEERLPYGHGESLIEIINKVRR